MTKIIARTVNITLRVAWPAGFLESRSALLPVCLLLICCLPCHLNPSDPTEYAHANESCLSLLCAYIACLLGNSWPFSDVSGPRLVAFCLVMSLASPCSQSCKFGRSAAFLFFQKDPGAKGCLVPRDIASYLISVRIRVKLFGVFSSLSLHPWGSSKVLYRSWILSDFRWSKCAGR